LESRREDLRKQGLGLASVSYDSPQVLRHFADRKKIGYPLLSDPGSATIRAFGILNEAVTPGTMFHGIPHPVTFVVDPKGRITRKYAEADYRERQTLSGVLVRDFGMAPTAAAETKAKHVQITAGASTATVYSGERIALALTIAIPKGYHLYAPGVEGYHAVDWKMADTIPAKVKPAEYPKSRILYIKAIEEKVPVYEGQVRLVRDVTIADDKTLQAALGAGNTALTLEGSFKYQACSETLCYPPETVPLRWSLQLAPHDRVRVPAELQKK
jgi:hypothetical protein